MCGIAGIVSKNIVTREHYVIDMLGTIKHRGPDDTRIETIEECTLGHVRLSIVDLENGKQPMYDNSGDCCVVFNGEIYGYREIRKELEHDYFFRTECDTEVILALYQKYGIEMLSHLPGMFSFAIWDNKKKILFCARDRFGEKPFFYAIGKKGELIFASEIRAIIKTGLVDPIVDYNQIQHFLKYSYIYPTKTIYKNIYTLAPASYLLVNDYNVKSEKYWTLPSTKKNMSISEAVDNFRYLFEKAVKNQIIADVPVGAYLSGGMDSGSVVAMASKFKSNLTTISFGFNEGINELSLAREMSQKYGTHHIEVTDSECNIADELIKINEIFDEPLADPAAIPARIIASEAKKYVSVVLTGDGGDEILGGYDKKYRALKYLNDFKGIDIDRKEKEIDFFISIIRSARKFARKAGLYEKGPTAQLRERYYHDLFIKKNAIGMYKNGEFDFIKLMHMNQIVSDDVLSSVGFVLKEENFRDIRGYLNDNELDNAVRYDILSYLPGDGMTKTDRTTMSVSLESRAPFLDYKLAEFCISLPFDLKVSGKEEKVILRRAMERQWTKGVRRCVKNGFSPPMDKWLSSSPVRNLIAEYLGNKENRIYSFFDYSKLKKAVLETEMQYSWFGWELLILSMWMERYL